MTGPTYKLETADFDGPLDLLLRLIEKNKVDICDIPIAEITKQYLEQVVFMEQNDMEITSDFLVMAATLLDIKARMLLTGAESSEEEADPREELAARLLEYKRCKLIAGELRENEIAAARQYYRRAALPEEFKSFVPPVDLDALLKGITAKDLSAAYEGLCRRAAAAVNKASDSLGTIKRDRMSIVRCLEKLRAFTAGHRRFTFRQMMNEGAGRAEIVVSFLAVLELMRLGKVDVEQQPESDIRVEMKPGADLNDIDLRSLFDE